MVDHIKKRRKNLQAFTFNGRGILFNKSQSIENNNSKAMNSSVDKCIFNLLNEKIYV